MGRKRKNVPAGLLSVFWGLLCGQGQGRAVDKVVPGDRLVTEECVHCTVPRSQFLLFLILQAVRSRMKEIK